MKEEGGRRSVKSGFLSFKGSFCKRVTIYILLTDIGEEL